MSPFFAYGIFTTSSLTNTSSSCISKQSSFMLDDRKTLIPLSVISVGLYVSPRLVPAISLNLRCSQEII